MRQSRSPKNELLFLAFSLFRLLVRVLPERWGDWMGRQVGILVYRVLPDRRATAMANIRSALELAGPEAVRLAKASFASLGLLGVEFLRFAGRGELVAERVPIVGEEHLRRALALGRGVILLHSHLGNWELLGQALSLGGYRIHPVVKVQASDRFYAAIDRQRRAAGLMPITRGFSLREMLRALAKGEIVLIMPDQDAGRKGVFVPFFGRPASTPRGLAVVARLSGAPMVPAFIRRTRPGYHEVRIYPPLELVQTGNTDADELQNLERINLMLEKEIRRDPEEWLWMHKRWKTRPPGEVKPG